MKAIVIGVGRMGRRHVQVLRDLQMDIVGLCDQSPASLEAARQEQSLPNVKSAADPHELLRDEPEAVVIATTAPSHAELTIAAAKAGARYILCEKPMATSIAEADEMLKVCAAAGTRLAINHQMQFMPQYTEVKAAAASAELGGLVSVLVSASNFGLAMNGSHYFEMFRYLTGEHVQSLSAWFDEDRVPNPRGAQFEDRGGTVRASTASGVSMVLHCSVRAGHGVQVVYVCRYGQILVDELSGHMRIIRRQDEYRELPTTRYGMPAVETVRSIVPADVIAPTRAVWDAVLAGRPFPDSEAGRHAVLCLCAAHASHERGNVPVQLDDARIDRARRFPWA